MSIVGTDALSYRQVSVVSTSPLPQLGWTPVQSVSPWNPPNGTASANDIVLVCWGLVGDINQFGPSSNTDALLICIGDEQFPYVNTLQRVKMDARLTGRQGVPFFFVNAFLASQGNAWPANRTPHLWAKCETVQSTAQFQFTVTGAHMLSFYDAAMNAYRWNGRMLASATPSTNGSVVHTFTPPLGAIRADGKYLAFCSVRLVQRDNTRMPQLELTHNDISAGSVRRLLGRRSGPPNIPRWGLAHRGVNITASNPQFPNSIRCGAWFLIDNLGANDSFDLSLSWRNQVATPAALIEVFDAEFYMVHESNLGAFVGQQQTYLTGFAVHQDVSVSPINFEPLEVTLPQSQDMVAIACSRWLPRQGGLLFFGYQQRISLDGGFAASGDVYAETTDPREGVYTHVGMGARLPAESTRFAGYAIQNPLQPRAGVVETTDELCMATWSWENDPDFQPSQPPVEPIATWLTLDRESLGLGALQALPIEPEQSHVRTLELPRNEFIADDGTRVTWPAYLSVRRVFEFIWQGMPLDQRDTLFAFFEANRTFKWTPPDSTQPIALLLSQAINSADVGARHCTITAQAIQLVWIGP